MTKYLIYEIIELLIYSLASVQNFFHSLFTISTTTDVTASVKTIPKSMTIIMPSVMPATNERKKIIATNNADIVGRSALITSPTAAVRKRTYHCYIYLQFW